MKFGRTKVCELKQKWVFLFVRTEITQNAVSQNMKSYNVSNEKTPEIMKIKRVLLTSAPGTLFTDSKKRN